jgi:hypothetical protein
MRGRRGYSLADLQDRLNGEMRDGIFVTRAAPRDELRLQKLQLSELTARLRRQEAQIEDQAARLSELATFDRVAEVGGGVFISYAHADSDIVDELAARLAADNINYWRDDKDLLVGDVIDKAISRGIQQSVLFLIVLTPASITSKWVERELDEAAHEEADGVKIVMPVVAKGLAREAVPPRLRRKLYVDISGSLFESGYGRLVHSIRRHLDESRPPPT